MRKMTIEELLMKEDDATLLNIYNELESGVIPATSYAHAYVRKVNQMLDKGELCVKPGSYRNVYLPSVSKMLYKEMARRYSMVLHAAKTMPSAFFESTPNGAADDEVAHCAWCNCEYDASDLVPTDLGMMCETCIMAIRSRGEDVAVLK